MEVKILGAFGSKFKGKKMLSILIENKVIIDAGNIMESLGEESFKISDILISHLHLDHIADIPFLIAESFPVREKPLNIWSQKETLNGLKKYIMNQKVWPDFTKIKLNSNVSSVNYLELKANEAIDINGLKILPFKSNHTIPTLGFMVVKDNKSFVFSGDTHKNNEIWETINRNEEIKALFIDVSYPKRMSELGKVAKHLSTDAFEEELKNLKRKIKIFVIHVKPVFFKEVKKEIKDICSRTGLEIEVLEDGDKIKI